jgi:hypothetical protein
MFRTFGALLLAASSALVPLSHGAESDAKAASFTRALIGDWTGTLEYRDYSNDKRVTLPTTLNAKASEDGNVATLKFRYDEGKGRFEEGLSTLQVDASHSKLIWESDGGKTKSEYAFTGLETFNDKSEGQLILTGTGDENKLTVEIRQTITVKGEELTILRESKKPGETFAFRNTYKLRRVPKP